MGRGGSSRLRVTSRGHRAVSRPRIGQGAGRARSRPPLRRQGLPTRNCTGCRGHVGHAQAAARASPRPSKRTASLDARIAKLRDLLFGKAERADFDFAQGRVELEKAVTEQSALQRRLRAEEAAVAQCRRWLENLPSDAVLEPIEVTVPPDATLSRVRAKLKAAETELALLRAAPTPTGHQAAPQRVFGRSCEAEDHWHRRGREAAHHLARCARDDLGPERVQRRGAAAIRAVVPRPNA